MSSFPHSVVIRFEIQVTENYLQMDRLIPKVLSSSLLYIIYGFRIEFKAVVENNVFTLIFEKLPEWIVICIID